MHKAPIAIPEVVSEATSHYEDAEDAEEGGENAQEQDVGAKEEVIENENFEEIPL